MVVAGVHEGKNEINARIGYFKLGINLKTEKPSPSQIKANVEIIFRNPVYRNNVARLAEEFEEYNPTWLCEKYLNDIFLKTGQKHKSNIFPNDKKICRRKGLLVNGEW